MYVVCRLAIIKMWFDAHFVILHSSAAVQIVFGVFSNRNILIQIYARSACSRMLTQNVKVTLTNTREIAMISDDVRFRYECNRNVFG
jgi:hypothetical protein